MRERRRRIVIAGGGTGGHLYPALAVADELKQRWPQSEIVFVGSRRGLETTLVPRAGYPLVRLRTFGMKGMGILDRGLAVAAAGWAVLRCLGWMAGRRPDLVIGVGGYASGPAVLAATILRRKTMVLEQNHYPGATNRWLAPRVDIVCVPSAAARERLGGIGQITGNPVRTTFFEAGEREDSSGFSLLVFGGSRGARSLNRAMIAALPGLVGLEPEPSIVHQTGADDESAVREGYARHPRLRVEVRAFLDDMPQRLAAADLVVCRAGAMTLAELAAVGRPAILVPYPHAADDHQRHNAETLQRAGAALMLLDQELDGERLSGAIAQLHANPAGRREMGRVARGFARPEATRSIADLAASLIPGQQGGAHVS